MMAPRKKTTPPKPRFTSITDAATMLGICDETVRRWGKKGLLRFAVVNGRRRIITESIDALIERGKAGKA